MRLNNDRATIDVRIDGESQRAIVLLAGFPLAREVWDEQVPALASTHRVIRPDLRGVGASSVPPGPYSMETLAGDIAAVLDALSIERVTLVGHSLGGYVALAFARMYAERIERLVLVCSRLAADTLSQARYRCELADRAEASDSSAEIVETMLPRLLAPQTLRDRPDVVERVRALASAHNPRGLAALLRGMALRDAANDIAPDLSMPVLVIAGSEDASLSLDDARSGRGLPRRAASYFRE